jgi:hypothetical protein
VDDANADLLGHVHETVHRLTGIWDQVSMDQATREKRTESAYTIFYSTMNEIVQNEEEMVKGVFEDIQKDLADVNATRQELGLGLFPVDKYTPNSIKLVSYFFRFWSGTLICLCLVESIGQRQESVVGAKDSSYGSSIGGI